MMNQVKLLKLLLLLGRIIVFCALMARETFANGESMSQDIREQCRSEVSGALILAHNDVDYLKSYVRTWEQKLRELAEAKKRSIQDREVLAKAIDAHPYDRKNQEQLVGLNHKIEAIQSEAKLATQLMTDQKEALSKASKHLSDLEPLVFRVFKKIYPKDLLSPEGYRFSLAFRFACGKYQYLCPLPATDRQHLKEIIRYVGSLESCQRYVQILPPQ